MNLRRWIFLALAVPAFAQAQAPAPAAGGGTTEERAASPTGEAAEPPAPKRRLKFKGDRPTCTCASALGEADIEAAEARKSTETPTTRRNGK